MRLKLLITSMLIALAAALAGGATFSYFTDTASNTGNTFTAARISVVSWRDRGDSVPHQPPVQWNGWPGPMFYTTKEEGAYPGPPEGKYPTGVWAPGDSWTRTLFVRNVDPEFVVRLEALSARLYGNVDLAPWFMVSVRDPHNQVLYRGTLADLAGGPRPLIDVIGNQGYLVMEGYSEQRLIFTVTMDPSTPNTLQGKTLKADFQVHVGQHRNRP